MFNWTGAGSREDQGEAIACYATTIVISGPTKLANSALQFTFTNTPGLSFTVLTTTNLAVPVNEWTSAGAAVESSPGHYQFTDATPNSPQRFFRVRSP